MWRNMRQARTNIAKGESRANGLKANWHDRAELYALRRSAKIAKVCKASKAQKLVFAFSSHSHGRCKRQNNFCFGMAEAPILHSEGAHI